MAFSQLTDSQVGPLLTAAAAGDEDARQLLFTRLYDELKGVAAKQLHGRRGGSLAATDLVHEAYLRLSQGEIRARERRHFLALAASAMRHVILDRARRSRAAKRDGGVLQTLHPSRVEERQPAEELLALDDALSRLAESAPELARLVELRYFAGLDLDETADALGLSRSSVKRRWRLARAWLRREIAGQGGGT